MADRRGAPTRGSHARHDLLLVAALVAGDATGTDANRGATLIDSCAECRAVADDLRAIQEATRAMGSAFDDPQRSAPRDLRLRPVDAERLSHGRRMGPWHRRAGRPWLTRLGTGLVVVGLGAIALSTGPLNLLGGAGGPEGAAFGTKVDQDTTAPLGPGQAAAPSSNLGVAPTTAPDRTVDSPAPSGPLGRVQALPLVAIGGIALVLGIAVLFASRAGRRAGP